MSFFEGDDVGVDEGDRTLAGLPLEKAKYYAQDRDFLLELEETVQHFEVSESRSQST